MIAWNTSVSEAEMPEAQAELFRLAVELSAVRPRPPSFDLLVDGSAIEARERLGGRIFTSHP